MDGGGSGGGDGVSLSFTIPIDSVRMGTRMENHNGGLDLGLGERHLFDGKRCLGATFQ